MTGMRHLALSAIGRDRPGIVAAVAQRLLDHGVNVEDSRMAILRGHFTMMLVLAAPPDVDVEALRAGLDQARAELELEALSLSEVADLEPGAAPDSTHLVTVYGADHPGIVEAVARALAERGTNIADLQTRLVGDADGAALYVMVLEVVGDDGLEDALAPVAREQGVDLTVRALERDAL